MISIKSKKKLITHWNCIKLVWLQFISQRTEVVLSWHNFN